MRNWLEIWVGNDLRRSVVQPPPQKRANSELKVRLLEALSSWVLKTSGGGEFRKSLGDLLEMTHLISLNVVLHYLYCAV